MLSAASAGKYIFPKKKKQDLDNPIMGDIYMNVCSSRALNFSEREFFISLPRYDRMNTKGYKKL